MYSIKAGICFDKTHVPADGEVGGAN